MKWCVYFWYVCVTGLTLHRPSKGHTNRSSGFPITTRSVWISRVNTPGRSLLERQRMQQTARISGGYVGNLQFFNDWDVLWNSRVHPGRTLQAARASCFPPCETDLFRWCKLHFPAGSDTFGLMALPGEHLRSTCIVWTDSAKPQPLLPLRLLGVKQGGDGKSDSQFQAPSHAQGQALLFSTIIA